jgi:hypothetical protein
MRPAGRTAAITVWLVRRLLARAVARRLVGVVRVAGAPRLALGALAVSTSALMTTAALGPSAAVEPLAGRPPFGWHAHPDPAVVTGLLAFTVLAGSYGVLGCLRALRRGWAPRVTPLLLAGLLASCVLAMFAPVGSSDPGSYVAYGRLAATGHDPYATTPAALTGNYHGVAEAPWQATTSIYGPIATGEQRLIAGLAGDGPAAPAHAVFLLGLVNALAFIVTGLILQRLAAGTAGRRRAAVLFSANPLLLFEGVAGAHIDVLVTCCVVAALAALRARGRFAWIGAAVAGLLGGVAAGLKASAALAGAGLAWALAAQASTGRRAVPRRQLIVLALGALVVVVPGYVWAGSHAFDQLGHASGFVSFADPWRIVTHVLEVGLGHDGARAVIRVAAWLAFAVFVALLHNGLPGPAWAGRAAGLDPARAALVLVLAWLLTAPYVLPWYAVIAFALLATLASSAFDRLLIYWTAILAAAYLPGRQVTLPTWLHDVVDGWKSGCAPVLLLGVTVVAAALCLRTRRDHR